MKKVLVIDNNEDLLGTFEQTLRNEGFDVATANSGPEGVERFHRDSFDLVITDIDMPGMSGFEVIDNIKRNFFVPVMLMSSDYLPVGPGDVNELGVNAIISKTIDNETLCNVAWNCILGEKVYQGKIF
ncbi:MAG: response regulator [Planctomycetes bacterium]|nr:response regulator [Planctomycetota bacterium]